MRADGAAALKDLADKGWLGWAYARLLSIQPVQRLALRPDERRRQDSAERDAARAMH